MWSILRYHLSLSARPEKKTKTSIEITIKWDKKEIWEGVLPINDIQL
jgi:hypothetical protein